MLQMFDARYNSKGAIDFGRPESILHSKHCSMDVDENTSAWV